MRPKQCVRWGQPLVASCPPAVHALRDVLAEANLWLPLACLQFMHFVMGLQSMTCLPLVISNQRILGVLRLGFDEPRNWVEQEKVWEQNGHE